MGSVFSVKQRIEILSEYRKVARNSKPSLEAHAGFLWLYMKGKFDIYLLWNFWGKVDFLIIVTVNIFTGFWMFFTSAQIGSSIIHGQQYRWRCNPFIELIQGFLKLSVHQLVIMGRFCLEWQWHGKLQFSMANKRISSLTSFPMCSAMWFTITLKKCPSPGRNRVNVNFQEGFQLIATQ